MTAFRVTRFQFWLMTAVVLTASRHAQPAAYDDTAQTTQTESVIIPVLANDQPTSDIVCVNPSGAAQQVFRNYGITMVTHGSFGVGDSTAGAAGDLDGDGDDDLVIANTGSQAQTVWLNDGTGGFAAHPTTPSFGAGDSMALALGDIDGDTDLDVIVANASSQAETVWLNDGSGNISAHPTIPSFGAGNSFGIALGDLDGDLDLDAVIANGSNAAQTVWLNDGSGEFTAHPTTPSFGAGDSRGIVFVNLDGDSDLDAVVANTSGQAQTVWLNDGSGNLSAHPTIPSFSPGSNSLGLALGDLDGDMDADCLVANTSGQAETVWLNDGSGAFTAHPTTPSFGTGDSTRVVLVNLDSDDGLDAIVANATGTSETTWINDGTGAFSAGTTFQGGNASDLVLIRDFDGLAPESVSVIAPPANGSTSINPVNGAITYTPATPYVGPDSFQYSASSGSATVHITVTSPVPVAVSVFQLE